MTRVVSSSTHARRRPRVVILHHAITFSVNVRAANSCKRHQQNRAKLAKRCDGESFWPRSVLGRTATARGHPVMSGRVSRRRIQRPICRDRASPFSVCFLALSIDEDSLSTENHKPRDPHHAARPKINWSFFKGSIRECCYMEVGAVSGVFVEVDVTAARSRLRPPLLAR